MPILCMHYVGGAFPMGFYVKLLNAFRMLVLSVCGLASRNLYGGCNMNSRALQFTEESMSLPWKHCGSDLALKCAKLFILSAR